MSLKSSLSLENIIQLILQSYFFVFKNSTIPPPPRPMGTYPMVNYIRQNGILLNQLIWIWFILNGSW